MRRMQLQWRRFRRHRTKHDWRLPLMILLTAAAFFVIVIWIETQLKPILLQKAEIQVDYIAVKAVNEAIGAKIAEDNIEYSNLVYFEKDIYGQITALQTNMITANRLKTEITNEVLNALHGIDHSELGIPMGNLFSGELFSGRGPVLPVRIVPLGTVEAAFSNAFSSAGINQTRHQIMMDITVHMSLLLPGSEVEKTITTQVCIAETIIVGNVPDSYLQFDKGTFEN